MPKWAPDAMLDTALDYVAASTAYHLCTTLDSTPTRTEVLAASVGSVTVTSGNFTKAAGDVSGRKVTVGAQTISITASGSANHVALIDGTNVRYVTTVSAQTVTSGNTANVGAFDIEIAAPA